MAYIDKVVDVTVTLGTSTVETDTFETPLFVAIHNVFPERYRLYSSLDSMVDDGFAVGSPAYRWADNVFQGIFKPQLVMIGKEIATGTVVDFTGTTNNQNVIANITIGGFVKSITAVYAPNDTPATLAGKLAAAIEADTDVGSLVEATATGAVISITPTTSGQALSVGYSQGNFAIKSTTAETVGTVLPQINAAYPDWYFLSTESHTTSDIQAAAEYAKANYKFHAYSTPDESVKTASNTANIMELLKSLSLDSVGMYHEQADTDFPEGGIVGAMASRDPSYGDSLHLKTFSGVMTSPLTESERAAIWGHNGNFYRTYAGFGAFWEGKTASGQYADTIRFSHWMRSRTEESVYAYMRKRSNLGQSMKMSDDDLPALKSIMMNSPINVGINNGSILTGYDTTSKVFYDPVVTIPKRASIPSADLANRVLNNVKVEVIYNNSLHFVKINVYILLDAADLSTNAATTA